MPEHDPNLPNSSDTDQSDKGDKKDKNLLFKIANHIVDWENLRIRRPYSGLARGIYRKVANKVKQNETLQKVTNDIKVRFVDDPVKK